MPLPTATAVELLVAAKDEPMPTALLPPPTCWAVRLLLAIVCAEVRARPRPPTTMAEASVATTAVPAVMPSICVAVSRIGALCVVSAARAAAAPPNQTSPPMQTVSARFELRFRMAAVPSSPCGTCGSSRVPAAARQLPGCDNRRTKVLAPATRFRS